MFKSTIINIIDAIIQLEIYCNDEQWNSIWVLYNSIQPKDIITELDINKETLINKTIIIAINLLTLIPFEPP